MSSPPEAEDQEDAPASRKHLLPSRTHGYSPQSLHQRGHHWGQLMGVIRESREGGEEGEGGGGGGSSTEHRNYELCLGK